MKVVFEENLRKDLDSTHLIFQTVYVVGKVYSSLGVSPILRSQWGMARESQKEYRHKQSRIVSYSPLALLHMTNLYGVRYHGL